jgi:hypothetical protein
MNLFLGLICMLMNAHQRGLYSLACDAEACQHYGIAEKEPGMRWWRARCYVSGFLRADKRGAVRTR